MTLNTFHRVGHHVTQEFLKSKQANEGRKQIQKHALHPKHHSSQ